MWVRSLHDARQSIARASFVCLPNPAGAEEAKVGLYGLSNDLAAKYSVRSSKGSSPVGASVGCNNSLFQNPARIFFLFSPLTVFDEHTQHRYRCIHLFVTSACCIRATSLAELPSPVALRMLSLTDVVVVINFQQFGQKVSTPPHPNFIAGTPTISRCISASLVGAVLIELPLGVGRPLLLGLRPWFGIMWCPLRRAEP